MNLILKLLLLPFKAIDEGLEILIFKVIFHRRLWFITVPLTVGMCWFGWQAWSAHRAAQKPAEVRSPESGVRSPEAPRPSPSPLTAASPRPSPSLAPSPRPSPSPSARPSPAPSPKPSPSTRPSPSPSPRPSPTASPALLRTPDSGLQTPGSRLQTHPLTADAETCLASQPPGPLSSDAVDLAYALAQHTSQDLEIDPSPVLPAPDGILLLRVLKGDTHAAAMLAHPVRLESLGVLPAPDAARVLTAVLQHGDRKLQIALLEALAQLDRPIPAELGSVIALKVSLRDRALVEAAGRATARLTDRGLAPVLEAVLGKLGGEERVAVARALAAMGSAKAKDELTAALNSKNGAIRAHALHGLAALGDPEAGPAAVEVSADPDYLIRHAAARYLVETSEKRGYEILAADLASQLEVVRTSARVTIAQLSERAQVGVLTQLIADKHLPGPARLVALRLLVASPARAATPTLQPLIASAKAVVRLAVAEELHPEQVKMLRPMLVKQMEKEDAPEVKVALARLLPEDLHARLALQLLDAGRKVPSLHSAVARALAVRNRDLLPELLKQATGRELQSPWVHAARLRSRP